MILRRTEISSNRMLEALILHRTLTIILAHLGGHVGLECLVGWKGHGRFRAVDDAGVQGE